MNSLATCSLKFKPRFEVMVTYKTVISSLSMIDWKCSVEIAMYYGVKLHPGAPSKDQ